MRLIPAILLAAAAASPAIAQTGTLDQDSPTTNVSFNGNLVNWDRAQTILCGLTGLLEGVTFEVYGIPPASSAVNVYGPFFSPSPPTGIPAGSFSIPGGGGGWVNTFVDMTSAGIIMNSGEYWTIEIIGAPGSCDYKGNQVYPWEMWETAGSTTYSAATGNTRVGLATYMLPVPAPVPTISLTGTCPGPATLLGTNMTPGGPVGIGFGFTAGTTSLPGGACAGAAIGVLNAQVIGFVSADLNGDFTFPGNLGPAACGGYVQVMDIVSCEASNVLSL